MINFGDDSGTMVLLRCTILLVLQATFNMLVAVGIMPVTGQPLPLISKGGTSTLVNCVYIGMILSISRYVNDLKRQQAEELLAQQTEQSQEIAPENNIIPQEKSV